MSEKSERVPTEEELEAILQKAQADARAAEAAARKAEAEARKAEAEAADLDSPSGQRARDGKNLQAVAEAEQKAAAARHSSITALVPDLSSVKESTLEVSKGEAAIAAGSLTFGALSSAAQEIAGYIGRMAAPTGGWNILVTSEQDLASPDSLYQEVMSGLADLNKAADSLLKHTAPTADVFEVAPLLPILSAALPHVLSLLSAERSVTTGPITVTDLAAATAVAGALEGSLGNKIAVVHDDFRLAREGRPKTQSAELAAKRNELMVRKLVLSDQKTLSDAELVSAKDHLKDAEKALADADKTKPHPDLEAAVNAARDEVKQRTIQSHNVTTRVSMVEALLSSIDAFTAAIRVVPTGGRRSPFATAVLLDQLHGGDSGATPAFSHALLVKAQPAQFSQLTSDKPLWINDKFSTMVEVTITYMLIATSDSSIARAGAATATAVAYGRLGDKFAYHVDTHGTGKQQQNTEGNTHRFRLR